MQTLAISTVQPITFDAPVRESDVSTTSSVIRMPMACCCWQGK